MKLDKIWKGFHALPGPRKGMLAMVSLLILASLGAFVYLANQEDYRVLFSNLPGDDAAAIITKLKEKKIPYQISPSGDTISVPSSQVSELRLELAAAGVLQGGGVGFEIFDNRIMGATEFEQQLNYRRALQGELARTINSLDEIQQSRIHIALPKESLFIEQQKKATASVTIKFKPGRKLQQSQIEGIGHLVASSVEGMNPDDVMIVDSQGNILSKKRGDSRLANLSSSQMEYQRNIERGLANQIQTMLENVVGPGKAVVRVSADLNFKITEKTEEIYDPDSPVIRSTQKQTDRLIGRAAVPAGRETANIAADGSDKEKTDETINYEINKTISKTVMPVGEIKQLSIAVLVDGLYPKNDKGIAVYQERSKKELESLEDLVRKSAGFNTQRGDQVAVASMPFTHAEGDEPLIGNTWQDHIPIFMPIVKYVVLVIGLLLALVFVIKPLIKTITPAVPTQVAVSEPSFSTTPDVSVELSGSGPQPLALEQLNDENMTEIELAKHLAGTNSKKFAEVIRNWLK